MSDHRAPVVRGRRLQGRGLFALAALALFALGFTTSPSLAIEVDDFQVQDTMDLYQLCSAQQGQPYYEEATLLCIGYFTGAIDYHNEVVGPEFPPIVCAPPEVTRRQVIDNFIAWAKAHMADTELMQQRPIIGGVMSAMETWPCPGPQ